MPSPAHDGMNRDTASRDSQPYSWSVCYFRFPALILKLSWDHAILQLLRRSVWINAGAGREGAHGAEIPNQAALGKCWLCSGRRVQIVLETISVAADQGETGREGAVKAQLSGRCNLHILHVPPFWLFNCVRQQKQSETQQLESKYSTLFEKFSSDETMFEESDGFCIAIGSMQTLSAGQALAGASRRGAGNRWSFGSIPWNSGARRGGGNGSANFCMDAMT